MKIELISHTQDAAALCGEAAATCTDAEDKEAALRHATGAGHGSVLEHASFTFRIEGLSRAALGHLTRHRLASFSVQSQRYTQIDGEELEVPDSIKASGFREDVESLMRETMALYKRLCDVGIPKEDARYITPQAATTTLILTMNARELRHFFKLRCCNRAQWEIRELADGMLKICKDTEPLLFDDAGPDCLSGECKEKRPCGRPREKGEWDGETADAGEPL